MGAKASEDCCIGVGGVLVIKGISDTGAVAMSCDDDAIEALAGSSDGKRAASSLYDKLVENFNL